MTLLLSSFVVYAMVFLAPGDPLGFLTGGHVLPAPALAALKAHYHLDQPFLAGYVDWLSGLLHGNLGQSVVYQEPVSSIISQRAGVTLFLVIYASLLTMVIGVALGVPAGVRGGRIDATITAVTTVGLATPAFVVAVILISIFGVSLHVFPVFGAGTGFGDRLSHLTLPAVALAISGLAYIAQTTRAAVSVEATSEHAETARSRGIPEGLVIRRHIVRNSLAPIVTAGGLSIAGLVVGVAIVETAFNIPGLGAALVQSVAQKDFAVAQAIALLLVVAFVVVNLIVDIMYPIIDPRLRSR